jgi:hypothetical protein
MKAAKADKRKTAGEENIGFPFSVDSMIRSLTNPLRF